MNLLGKSVKDTYNVLLTLESGSLICNGTGSLISSLNTTSSFSSTASFSLSTQLPSSSIIVSSKGIANGLSGVINDGAQFGPDTTGTTTYGIQEAINSLTKVNALSSSVGGGRIVLGPGRFNCSGQLIIPNYFNYELQLQGSGKIATQLVYSGSSDFIVLAATTGSHIAEGGNKPFEFAFRDICFVALNGSNKQNLIYFKNKANQGVIENCSFTQYECLSFSQQTGSGGVQGQGGGLLFIGGTPATASGVVGVRMDGGFDNKVKIAKSDFYGLAAGIIYGPDHGVMEDLMMVSIGKYWNPHTLSSSFGTAYTASSVPSQAKAIDNILSQGACIICNDNIYDVHINRCYFMESNCAIVNSNLIGFGPNLRVIDPFNETMNYFMFCSLDQNGESFSVGTILSLGNSMGTAFNGSVYIDVTTGNLTTTTPITPASIKLLDHNYGFIKYSDLMSGQHYFSSNLLGDGQFSSSFSGSLIGTATNAISAQTASVVSQTQNIITLLTGSNNGITASFTGSINQKVILSVGKPYVFTSSNAPSLGQTANLNLFISHSSATSSSLVFPSNWYNLNGGWPNVISASRNARLSLTFEGNLVEGLWYV